MSQDIMMFQAADASAATALVTDGSDGSLWGVSLPGSTVMGSEGDKVMVLVNSELAPELEDVTPSEVELLSSGGFTGFSSLSGDHLCYYILGKASS